ncbi:MAG: NUDIX domain-containing protein [Oscillospiraceae bacterium]|nr:NUDIX domain-containing protein [Oscillospiraceae bacterium]
MKADIIVKCIIFNRDLKKILLVKRSKNDPIGANTWENAGGNIESGEHPEEAVRREIREETGITDINIERVAYVTLVNGEAPYLIIAYLCETKTEAVTVSSEHQAFVWADRDECKRLLPKPITEDFEKNRIFESVFNTAHQ